MDEPITLDGLIAAVGNLKEEFPYAGMERVASPFIPDGVEVYQSRDKMAFAYRDTGKVVVMDRPDLGKMRMRPIMPEWNPIALRASMHARLPIFRSSPIVHGLISLADEPKRRLRRSEKAALRWRKPAHAHKRDRRR